MNRPGTLLTLLCLLSPSACAHQAAVVDACMEHECPESDEPSSAPEGKRHLDYSVGPNTSIDALRVRGDTVIVRATARAYCGGTPPGPRLRVTIEVPEHVDDVKSKTRKKGRCKGPPMP